MKLSCNSEGLVIMGHPIQLFAHLSPFTVQKRQSLKPLLQVLAQKDITYRWSFSLRLNFSYRNKAHSFSSFPEGEGLFLKLGLISQEFPLPPATKVVDRLSTPIMPMMKHQALFIHSILFETGPMGGLSSRSTNIPSTLVDITRVPDTLKDPFQDAGTYEDLSFVMIESSGFFC